MSKRNIVLEDLKVLSIERSSVLKITHILEKELGKLTELKEFKELLENYQLLHSLYNKLFLYQRRIEKSKRIRSQTVELHSLTKFEINLVKHKIGFKIDFIEYNHPEFKGLLRPENLIQ